MSLLSLKSGTDIRGTALGENNELSDETISKIIKGFICVLSDKTGLSKEKLKVSVGHDSRLSSNRIKKAVIETLLAYGIEVYDCCLSSTPAMFLSTLKLPCNGAVQITASHHPFDKNGLKFFTKQGGFEGKEIERVLTLAKNTQIPLSEKQKIAKSVDFMEEYARILRYMICEGTSIKEDEKPLDGLKIAVDAGNGVGGFYAHNVLLPLGADISGSQFLEPDGYFKNHIPNPEDKEAMRSISEAVIKSKSDLGVIFDTDVDRAACVNFDGEEINRNRLVALASVIALNKKGGTIVTDSVTSDGLHSFIEDYLGGVHHRFKRGYKNVINEAIRLNNEGVDCPLAIETSGHAAFRENYFLDDGAYLVTKIIILMANRKKQGLPLISLIKDLKEPLEEREMRFKILTSDFKSYGETIIGRLEAYARTKEGLTIAPDNYEGIRIAFDKEHGDGFLILRLSVHDPILVLNIESNIENGSNIITQQFYEFIKDFVSLDLSPLQNI